MKIIYIEWLDPHSLDPWTDVVDVELDPCKIKSIGVFLKEDSKTIAIATNFNEENKDASCIMVIPKSAIVMRCDGAFDNKGVTKWKKKKT